MDDVMKRACGAYFARFGTTSPQPSVDLSGKEHSGLCDPQDHVVLRNIRGELARYRVCRDGALRFVHPHPKAG